MPIQRRGTKALLAAAVVSQFFALLRYVILARVLGPTQLGLAATLILTQGFFELISDMAADRFIVQDKDGDDASVQKFVQLVLVVRGALIALAMVVCAWPLAYFYKAPELAPALAAIGLVSLVQGFIHLDMRRAQRKNDFRSEAFSTLSSEGIGLVVTVVAAYLTGSYISVVYGLVARALAFVVPSHMLAERKYTLGYVREHGPRLAKFSIPLVFTGIILFFSGQGDRVLVARYVGFAGLGHYSAVLLLVFYPATTLLRFFHTMYLPLIAATHGDPGRRTAVSSDLGGQTLLLSLGMAAGFAIVAPPAIPILYGRAFVESTMIVALIGILQSARFLVLWPTTVALAMGRSSVVLANNVLRLIAWPLAIFAVTAGFGLVGIVSGFILGEVVANSAALILLNRSENNSMFQGFDRFAAFVIGSVIIIGWAYLTNHFSIVSFCILAICSGGLVVWIYRSEIATIRGLINNARLAIEQVL